jgi:hypothetical protein
MEKLQKRREDLVKGLESLLKQKHQLEEAIIVQRGAISECDYWIQESVKDKETVEETVEDNK